MPYRDGSDTAQPVPQLIDGSLAVCLDVLQNTSPCILHSVFPTNHVLEDVHYTYYHGAILCRTVRDQMDPFDISYVFTNPQRHDESCFVVIGHDTITTSSEGDDPDSEPKVYEGFFLKGQQHHQVDRC